MTRHLVGATLLFFLCGLRDGAQNAPTAPPDVRAHLKLAAGAKMREAPAVLWLQPEAGTTPVTFRQHSRYTLTQKNRTFTPHLLIVPVGSAVSFPNEDPFFHNVFSLYNGKRFDLGLYEAGSSRDVTFTREGVSYIFCNIHPEMSAVVLALSTPLYAIGDSSGAFSVHGVPPGVYTVHVWVEGVPQQITDQLTRRVHVTQASVDLGDLPIPVPAPSSAAHANEFGLPYGKTSDKQY